MHRGDPSGLVAHIHPQTRIPNNPMMLAGWPPGWRVIRRKIAEVTLLIGKRVLRVSAENICKGLPLVSQSAPDPANSRGATPGHLSGPAKKKAAPERIQ